MSDITIRNATLADAPRILEIYAYYVEHTVITFEYDVPSLAEFEDRMRAIMQKYPYLVIERDGRIEGYAYAHAFVGRAAYDWAAELTIYLDHDARRGGMGRVLYEALADRLKAMGVLNLYACIGYPQVEDEYLTRNSAQFHEHLGFTLAGTFHNCGYKFGRWYDMIWMEKSSASTAPTSRTSCRINIEPMQKSRCIQRMHLLLLYCLSICSLWYCSVYS